MIALSHTAPNKNKFYRTMAPELEDNKCEGDYLDHRSMSTANEVLQRAITRPETDPPVFGGRQTTQGPALHAMMITSMEVAPLTMPPDMATGAKISRRPIPQCLDQTCLLFMMYIFI